MIPVRVGVERNIRGVMALKITIPGFQFAGIHCGIKDSARKKDLALIYSEEPDTLVDGVFTTNKVCAAPVTICRQVVKKGYGRLIVINSGVANACTGPQGMQDAKTIQKESAKFCGLKQQEVLVCSTGKIGDYLPVKRMVTGLKKATKILSARSFMKVAQGIMTTDQYPKFASVQGEINGTPYTIAVVAKGAGMLCPNMATMLVYILTDLNFDKKTLRTIFRNAVDQTLNRVTVDGDTSTNDTVLILANGKAGNELFDKNSPLAKKIKGEIIHLLEIMARKIALDGEGATKCCDVFVNGAKKASDARKIAYAIGNSPLVKTALFGCDPNWGRIMAAVGYSGAQIKQEKLSVTLGPYLVASQGMAAKKVNWTKLAKYMKQKYLTIKVDCGIGSGKFNIYMSDLTYDYIHLNAEYHT